MDEAASGPTEQPGDRPERMLRELQATIAEHVGDAARQAWMPHGRATGRGRLIGAASLGGTDRATILLAHVTLSAARMLQRPALLLDLTGTAVVPSHACELPALAELTTHRGLLAVHDAFARAHTARLGIARAGDGPEPPATAIADLLAELTRRYPLVVVHSAPGAPARTTAARLADEAIAIGLEGDTAMLRRARLLAERDVVVMGDGLGVATEGDRRRLARDCRARMLRVVPAATLSLVRDGGDDDREPWRTVDWLARHFLQRKVGLALGAGAAGGYAHLGVIAALRAEGLPIDYLAASGIGAPLAAGLALGAGAEQLRDHLDATFHQLTKPRLPWPARGGALAHAAQLRDVVARLTGDRAFEDLEASLALVATDLDRGETRVLDGGSLTDAVLASAAIPAVLPPLELDGARLVDGAVLNPLPVDVLRAAGADVTIGVRLPPAVPSWARDAGWRDRLGALDPETAVRAYDLMQGALSAEAAAAADVLVAPRLGGGSGLRDWDRADEFIAAGHAAAEAALMLLHARLSPAGAPRRTERVAA